MWPGRQNNRNHPIRTADKKPKNKNDSNKRDIWDIIKYAKLYIIGIPEEKKEKWRPKMYLKKL